MSVIGRVGGALMLVLLLCAPGVASARGGARAAHAHHKRVSARPLARTSDGMVRGVSRAGVDEFLGIPYAKPPVGALRWRPPVPASRWHGVRSAVKLPPRCPQLANSNGPRSVNENCLYLSIYRPVGTKPRSKLPVLFWIHGGGLTTGSGDQHNGSLFAEMDGIEVVSINYRLGVFGFLALPSLSAEASDHASGDYGLLDEEAALRWVHGNIRAFGGDPRDVTIAGESAGGYSVCSLLTSPPVRGLFARAIIQSGSCVSLSLSAASSAGASYAAAAGCGDAGTAAACLRAKSASALLDDPKYPSADVPTVGGSELPVDPASQVAAGQFAHVPLLIGTNHNEARTFAQGDAGDSEQQYDSMIASDYGSNAPAVLAEYPWSSFGPKYTTAYALGAAWTDSGFVGGIGGCATQKLAGEFSAHVPTFFYQFDDEHAPGLNRKVPGYQWGAGHAMELAYMWPSFDNGYPLYPLLSRAQKLLSRHMVRYWGAFVTAGSPAVPVLRPWPAYSSGRIMSLRPGNGSVPITNATFSAEHRCSFWNSLPAAGGSS